MAKIELMHGDCLEKMKNIPDKSIDDVEQKTLDVTFII